MIGVIMGQQEKYGYNVSQTIYLKANTITAAGATSSAGLLWILFLMGLNLGVQVIMVMVVVQLYLHSIRRITIQNIKREVNYVAQSDTLWCHYGHQKK